MFSAKRTAAWLLTLCCALIHSGCGTELGNPFAFIFGDGGTEQNSAGIPPAPNNGLGDGESTLFNGAFFKNQTLENCPDDFQGFISVSEFFYELPLAQQWQVTESGNPLIISETQQSGSITIDAEILPVSIENLISYVQLSEPQVDWHNELTSAGYIVVVADATVEIGDNEQLTLYFSNATVVLRVTLLLSETGLLAAACMLDSLQFLPMGN